MKTSYSPKVHHRRSIRLRGYDYSQMGAYFVTVCAHKKECVFGEVVHDEMKLNVWGEVIVISWNNLPRSFSSVELDAFVVMPNHLHGIIFINGNKGEATANASRRLTGKSLAVASPLHATTHGTAKESLGAIMQTFKSLSTRRINAMRRTPGSSVWQRNYYEHIIRNADELNRIRRYVVDNPLQWALDAENPACK